jgi:hypothetical protein
MRLLLNADYDKEGTVAVPNRNIDYLTLGGSLEFTGTSSFLSSSAALVHHLASARKGR